MTVAGGMNKRGSYGSMAERVARSASPDLAAQAVPQVKHCWVIDAHGRLPALLLGWEQRAGGWRGRVVHPVLEDDDWLIVEEWLPSELLQPTDASDRPG